MAKLTPIVAKTSEDLADALDLSLAGAEERQAQRPSQKKTPRLSFRDLSKGVDGEKLWQGCSGTLMLVNSGGTRRSISRDDVKREENALHFLCRTK